MKKIVSVFAIISILLVCCMASTVMVSARNARGDATGDSSVDMKDVLAIRKSLAGLSVSEYDAEAADANGDSSVDMKDVLLIRKYLAGLPVEFAPYEDDPSPVADPNLIPDQITMNLYGKNAEGLAFTWHTCASDSNEVLQFVEGKNATDFSNATEVKATKTEYSTDTMEYDRDKNTFVFGTILKVKDYCYQAYTTDLKPATSYTYRVGDKVKGIWSETGSFTTKDTSATSFSFVDISDTQVSSQMANNIYSYTNNALAGALKKDSSPDFIMHNGDIVQRSGWLHQWRNYFNGSAEYYMNYPVVPVTGNHDSTYDTAGDHEIVKHFLLDYPDCNDALNYGVYYSFDYLNAHFICLNTDNFKSSKGAIDEVQYKWLEEDLKANTKQWTIVSLHRPLVCLRDTTTGDISRNQLLNLFNEYGVDLVIQGHEHVFEHSYPIGKDDTVYKDATSRTEDGTKYYVNPNGVLFVTCATGGSDGKAPLDAADTKWFEAFAKGNASSFGLFTIDGNKLSVGVYYGENATAYSGSQFGIIKE